MKQKIDLMIKIFLKFLLCIVTFCLCQLCPAITQAQQEVPYYPKVGEQLPDHTFTDVLNYSKNSFSIKNFMGKWLVLDYWSEGCAGCIASFPKMDQLRKDFAGKVEIIMVGAYTKQSDRIKALFKKKCSTYNLTFPSAFDNASINKYDIGAVPAIFILDPNGTLIAKTVSLDSPLLSKIIKGEKPHIIKSYSAHEKREADEFGYNYDLPLLTSGDISNGGIDTSVLFRSLLAKWNPNMPENRVTGFMEREPFKKGITGLAEAIGQDISSLFLVAYLGRKMVAPTDSLYGRFSTKVFFELRDTLNSSFVKRTNVKTSDNTFAYSLKVPLSHATVANACKILLNDLHRFFGFTSSIQERELEVYKLIVTDQKLALRTLKTKGFDSAVSRFKNEKLVESNYLDSITFREIGGDGSFGIYNFSMKRFMQDRLFFTSIAALNGFDFQISPPVIDETKINFKIDFEFIGDHRDINDVIANLKRYGLDLIKGKKTMKCIVVKNAQ